MHIKQVVVEGFKTYREQTAVDFQPHLNCIGASRRRMRARTFPTAFATLPARAPFQNLVQISSLSRRRGVLPRR